MRKGLRISNYIHGGGQEMGRRAGTENMAGIVGFGKAAEVAEANFDEHIRHCKEVRDYLIEKSKQRNTRYLCKRNHGT